MKLDHIPESKALKKFKAVVGKEQFEKGLAKGEAKGEAKGLAKGEAKGKAEGVILLLEARGLILSEKQREQIMECRHLETLRKWLVGAHCRKHSRIVTHLMLLLSFHWPAIAHLIRAKKELLVKSVLANNENNGLGKRHCDFQKTRH